MSISRMLHAARRLYRHFGDIIQRPRYRRSKGKLREWTTRGDRKMGDIQRSMELLKKAERMCECQSIAQAATAERWFWLACKQKYLLPYVANKIEGMARGIVNGAVAFARHR